MPLRICADFNSGAGTDEDISWCCATIRRGAHSTRQLLNSTYPMERPRFGDPSVKFDVGVLPLTGSRFGTQMFFWFRLPNSLLDGRLFRPYFDEPQDHQLAEHSQGE
jgi:hypothetical protein